jgi:hypothetical protein
MIAGLFHACVNIDLFHGTNSATYADPPHIATPQHFIAFTWICETVSIKKKKDR